MHGANDKLVPPEQSKLFYNSAVRAGVEAQLEIVPHKGHAIYPPAKVQNEIHQFLKRHLAPTSDQ
jgi:dipeptidyl aminopeptidase/acylaminoacyl peptidase